MPITNPQEKSVHELCLVYDAEHQFLEAQQQMIEQASDGHLQSMLQNHINQTERQIQQLEQVFNQLGQEPQRMTSQAAQGLVVDGQTSLQEAESGRIADVLISSAQAKVEYFEIGSYKVLVTAAQQMGQDQIVELLKQNLLQEQETAQMVEQNAPLLEQQAMQAA